MDIVGIIVAIAVFVTSIAIIQDKSSDYDERQVAVMGKGYKIAVFTMAGLLGVGSVIYEDPAALPVSAADYMFVTLVAGAVTFMLYAVWHGAYFRVHEKNARTVGILFAILGALCLTAAPEDGDFWNVAFGLCYLVTGISILVRMWLDTREAADEDGEDAAGKDGAE